MEKVFISYNHKDQGIVDLIANKLAISFGQDNIFYDSWTIQPGDSIIGKMDEGLSEYTTFFLFVSPNSLSSKMVSLEWKAALYRAVNENLKFVCVRIADCKMPAILADKNYIDLYNEDADSALYKMIAVVNGKNTYVPSKTFKNLSARIVQTDKNFYEITFSAKQFVEQSPTFGVGCGLSLNDFSLVNMGPLSSYNQCILTFPDGNEMPIRTVSPFGAIKPGFSYTVGLSLRDDCTININNIIIFSEVNSETGKWERI